MSNLIKVISYDQRYQVKSIYWSMMSTLAIVEALREVPDLRRGLVIAITQLLD